MKVPEAIEILGTKREMEEEKSDTEMAEAIQLGIEALKLLRYQRTYLVYAQNIILPGETPEKKAGSD